MYLFFKGLYYVTPSLKSKSYIAIGEQLDTGSCLSNGAKLKSRKRIGKHHYMLNFIGKMFLSKEARELGESLSSSGITGAKVVGRATLICDARSIAQSKEFKELQAHAKEIISRSQ